MIAETLDDLTDRETLLGLSGLDFIRKMIAGELPQPPIFGTMNFRLTEAGHGRVVAEGAPQFAHLNPMRGVHGGWYGTLLDSTLGCAVMTVLPVGSIYTTLEYKVNLTGAIPLDRPVTSEATVSHAGRTSAVAEGTIRDPETGKLYATGSTTCLIMRP